MNPVVCPSRIVPSGSFRTTQEGRSPQIADRPVRKTDKNSSGDITALCNDGSTWSPRSKADAFSDIEDGRHTYHVPWESGRTEIQVVRDLSVSGGKYRRTDEDNTSKNNLDDLPDC